ncbi:hypothetical protein [Paraburkholderia kirstenboschensis]
MAAEHIVTVRGVGYRVLSDIPRHLAREPSRERRDCRCL